MFSFWGYRPSSLKEIGFDFFFFYKGGAVWLSPASSDVFSAPSTKTISLSRK